MLYPNDKHVFLLSIVNADGSNPNVTVAPTVTIINAVSGNVVVPATAMDLIAGTQKVYSYVWDTAAQPEATYLALVSYAADGVTVQGRMLESVRLGDSRVTGAVALDATVAKELTVAKDATVMKYAQYVLPKNDDYVRAIKSRVDLLPNDPASAAAIAALAAKLEDVHDFVTGTWIVDKANDKMTLYRKDGSVLQAFNLEDTDTHSNRLRV